MCQFGGQTQYWPHPSESPFLFFNKVGKHRNSQFFLELVFRHLSGIRHLYPFYLRPTAPLPYGPQRHIFFHTQTFPRPVGLAHNGSKSRRYQDRCNQLCYKLPRQTDILCISLLKMYDDRLQNPDFKLPLLSRSSYLLIFESL